MDITLPLDFKEFLNFRLMTHVVPGTGQKNLVMSEFAAPCQALMTATYVKHTLLNHNSSVTHPSEADLTVRM